MPQSPAQSSTALPRRVVASRGSAKLPRSGRSGDERPVGCCMADDADSAAAPRDFHYDRWKLAKYAAGSFGFTALGAYLIYRGAATIYANPGDVLRLLPGLLLAAIGLTTVAFFGMILIVAIGAFFDRTPVVTITA